MLEKLKFLIVEDEVLIAEDIKYSLCEMGAVNIQMVHSKEKAIEMIDKFVPDIVLLDVRMVGELDGIEVANYINEKYKIPFLFITSHSDRAMIETIVKTRPFAYITKPIRKSDLFAQIQLVAITILEKEERLISLKEGRFNITIDPNNILYFNTEGNYIDIFTIGKKVCIRMSSDRFLEMLPENIFVRIHRSYFVNKTKVEKFSTKEVVINKVVLPVSRTYANDVLELLKAI